MSLIGLKAKYSTSLALWLVYTNCLLFVIILIHFIQ